MTRQGSNRNLFDPYSVSFPFLRKVSRFRGLYQAHILNESSRFRELYQAHSPNESSRFRGLYHAPSLNEAYKVVASSDISQSNFYLADSIQDWSRGKISNPFKDSQFK